MRIRSTVLPVALALAFCAANTSAQAPGYQQLDIGAIRAEYRSEVLDRIADLLLEWGEAWAGDRVDEVTSLYWEDAIIIPPEGGLRRGQDEIRSYFDEVLSSHGSIEAFMLDFDASGSMAQVFGNYMLAIEQGEGAGSQKSGPMITVYMQRGRHWKIRSQVFLPS